MYCGAVTMFPNIMVLPYTNAAFFTWPSTCYEKKTTASTVTSHLKKPVNTLCMLYRDVEPMNAEIKPTKAKWPGSQSPRCPCMRLRMPCHFCYIWDTLLILLQIHNVMLVLQEHSTLTWEAVMHLQPQWGCMPNDSHRKEVYAKTHCCRQHEKFWLCQLKNP